MLAESDPNLNVISEFLFEPDYQRVLLGMVCGSTL